jgi:hypothetical protein
VWINFGGIERESILISGPRSVSIKKIDDVQREECGWRGWRKSRDLALSRMQFGRSIMSTRDGHELRSWLPMQGGMAADGQVYENKKKHH